MRAELAVIGGGNMAQAIMFGAIDAGVIEPGALVVCEPDIAKHGAFASRGIRATASHADALGALSCQGRVLLAVKPQSLANAAEQLVPHLDAARAVVTILAGTRIETIQRVLGGPSRAVVRVMPNTPARVRRGITALAAGPGVSADDRAFALELFGAVGRVVEIDESLMDAFTALAGSGPAYLFHLAESMIRAGLDMGFVPETADTVVRQTLLGAAALLAEEQGRSPEELRASVTSKGGTTEAALRVLEERGVASAVAAAIVAGRDRGRELGA
ncbi:MAG: pyrroline-5-carboxylate reductase [Phycisphaerales bacterium]